MHVTELELHDFRGYEELQHQFGSGTTVLVGGNGQGKTSLLEAIGWSATGKSFRGAVDATLVRQGCEQAIVRMLAIDNHGREQRIEAEIRASGRNRVLLNGRSLTRNRDRLDFLRITVFAPDDLELVKAGPGRRREYLDDLLAASAPRYRAARADYERVLKQRNALLRGGPRDPDAVSTLVVFDDQLVAAGTELIRGRLRLTERLLPHVAAGYQALTDDRPAIEARYVAEWHEGDLDDDAAAIGIALRAALERRRDAEWARGVTLVGPHRDEWSLSIDGLDARTQASQGEQRSLALALRLGGHALVTDVVGEPPVLLLDDVFSELDGYRADALVGSLPTGQTFITTAGDVPPAVRVEERLTIVAGKIIG